ncbi:DMT family transporter [Plantactinospora sp. GCM10030261]|uniref:DMT family transporter n=1 Tax=Plantactinospora sp. GCM10030261 TaxID=3273420 RepID=UPI003608A638
MTTPTTTESVDLRRWLPGFVALAAIWGSSFLFIKVGIRELHPAYVTLGRAAAGALTLLVVLAVLRQRLPRDGRLWAHMAVVGAVGVALPFTLFGYGEQRIPSLLAGIWNATTPLMVLPLAVLLFRTERLTKRRTAGMVLGFVGVLVVLGVWQGVGGAHLTGQLMCLAAAACYGFIIPYQKRFVAGRTESGLALAAAQLIMATGQLAVIAPLVAGAPPAPTRLSAEVVASVLVLGAFGTGLAFVINMRNIRLVGASTASTVTYLIPVFAVLVGVVVLDEHLVWHQPVGAAIVLAGVALSQWAPRRPPGTPDAAVIDTAATNPVAADPAASGTAGLDPASRPEEAASTGARRT